ncbi:MAG: hypothetical protein JO100_08405 [Pseudonocardia sp.]|nr:hypothetical protein [Pseudonocardia sp.]
MTSALTDADIARMRRGGMPPLTEAEGLALFDAALASPRAELVPMKVDLATVRNTPEAVPPLFHSLVQRLERRARAASGLLLPTESLGEWLARLNPPEQRETVLRVVVDEVAAVLGHGSADRIDPERSFSELGFDSLTAVELRNRLSAVTGKRLPSTLIFDYPTSVDLADHLLAELAPKQQLTTTAALSEIDRLEAVLASVQTHNGDRQEISRRLRNLVSAWVSADQDRGPEDMKIESASADELFALLDSELES